MLREDYILRIARQIAETVARLLGLTREQLYPQALEVIDQAMREQLGISSALAAQLPESTLIGLMTVDSVVDAGRLLLLADLLRLEGDIHAARGAEAEADRCYRKALNLFLEAASRLAPHALPDEFRKIELLTERLKPQGLPPATLAALFPYLESTGQYAAAEDALFALIELTPDPTALIERGISFYERLCGKTEAELQAGNLPRDEVEAGLAELLELRKGLQAC